MHQQIKKKRTISSRINKTKIKKYMSKNGYKFFVNFLAGAGYGFDLNSMSYSHFFSFSKRIYINNLNFGK